ncbi:P-loop ATPase, Sll1717 family [Clostridium butyricum]|uniref:P-loop ATPase, Sll1717 family n=1 Tax=Clostridium butyricum TaxID=1492 RepID=UPI00374E2CEA
MKSIAIKDIYAGKPDAKDEISFEGLDEFIKTFVVPNNCNLESLISGNYCFISGYKGTGKTALLFYLDNVIKEKDMSACSSFIFFKEELTESKKNGYEDFSRRMLSSISIERETLINNKDFEYIWRWLFFKRIIVDNEEFNDGLFINDEYWNKFKKCIMKIKDPNDKRKSIIPPKLKLGIPYTNKNTGEVISPELEVDFQKLNGESNFSEFINLIDESERAFSKVTRTDIPYHIFVDELEAYYGEKAVFERDLYLIRDLIFTVKRFNTLFSNCHFTDTKIICSIRTEIINAISRFIVTKELNKITSGFEVPLRWNYSNTNSFTHPILQILLRRIALSESEHDEEIRKDKAIINTWFNEKIYDIEPANYILNNSWFKPRDIVRLIISAQNSIHSDRKSFSQAVFDSFQKQYSIDSLIEIKEEMRALYSSEEIEIIINCFTGFRSMFSFNQLKKKIQEYYPDTILEKKLSDILSDLYRLGFIGNYFPASQMYRWQHKGDDRIILADEWRIMIHQALQSALSIGKRQDFSLKRKELPQIGDVVNSSIVHINKSFLNVKFQYYGTQYFGSIHISELNGEYIKDINTFASVGDELKTKILGFNNMNSKWQLSCKLQIG